MLFNSIDFGIFLPIVFFVYWFFPFSNVKKQNLFLIISSYVFYGWWNWRFLSLILISSFVDFFIGKKLQNTKKKNDRKFLLFCSIAVNIGFLAFFKYFNFFIESFAQAFTFLGINFRLSSLSIILPVGISFYTFQTMSYTIDVYRKKIDSTNDVLSFFAFVSFFPQLVAGPIERATNLLPQFFRKRTFDYSKATDGLRQMLWGFFKKIVIADNCAPIVNDIFTNYTSYSGSTLLAGAILFSFQIYGDFSGYSDIAIGLSKLFGFNLKQNFSYPYFSRDIAEFWRRWHISLSTWFRDYVYIPLGGSRVEKWKIIRNVFIIFVISGFWHGANWTFVIWGTIHALYFLPLMLIGKNRTNLEIVSTGSNNPRIIDILMIIQTFFLVTLAWIIFRANSIKHAFSYLKKIFSGSLFSVPIINKEIISAFFFVIVLILIEWIKRDKLHALESLPAKIMLRYAIYIIITCSILIFYPIESSEFIYFQF